MAGTLEGAHLVLDCDIPAWARVYWHPVDDVCDLCVSSLLHLRGLRRVMDHDRLRLLLRHPRSRIPCICHRLRSVLRLVAHRWCLVVPGLGLGVAGLGLIDPGLGLDVLRLSLVVYGLGSFRRGASHLLCSRLRIRSHCWMGKAELVEWLGTCAYAVSSQRHARRGSGAMRDWGRTV